LATHDYVLADSGGADGVRSLDGLDGAMGRPQNLAAYAQPDPDAADLAAAYAVGIAKAHAFVDGNKRTAYAISCAFLLLNGFAVPEEMSGVVLMVDIADDRIDQAAVAAWFRERLVPLQQG
jgi:death on curing protein